MLSATTARTTLRSSRAIRSHPAFHTAHLSSSALPRPRPAQLPWKLVGAVGAASVAYAVWQLKPELLPSPAPLYADAPPSSSTWIDPTTQTPFPSTILSPNGTKLRLVGSGVRTVSFLSIRVYTVAWYVSEKELEAAKQGKLEGWQGYTPEHLIPPYSLTAGDEKSPVGEELIDNLLEKADVAVVIVPLRNTSLGHLRDAFTRALLARMKVPRVAETMTPETTEQTGAALIEFKSFFPTKSLHKGSPLELYYSAVSRTVQVQAKNDKTGAPETLGTLRNALLAKELMVSYFSNTTAPSSELVKSVAMGFGGEGRP
ncbi:hypothetical protein JCM8547_001057 [Rhodosporidiobolus lusitaniae]